jgi:hypothetical protein
MKHQHIINNIAQIFNFEKYMNIFYIIYLRKNTKIIEQPTFHTATIEYKKDTIYLRQYCFTGLKGTLSLDITMEILNSPLKDKILYFLSIFSGRLLQLRSHYLLKLSPLENSYSDNFIKTLGGFHIESNIPDKFFLYKNKNIYNLKQILHLIIHGTIHIQKHIIFIIKHNNIQDRRLNFLLIGHKVFVTGINIIIYCINYQNILNIIYTPLLHQTIQSFSLIYRLKFYCAKEKIKLNHYILSAKIKFQKQS